MDLINLSITKKELDLLLNLLHKARYSDPKHQLEIKLRRALNPDSKRAFYGEKLPVCKTCNDTHKMSLHNYWGDVQTVMCTACPSPCQSCRQGGNGPYCEETPCKCGCHAR